MCMVCVRNIHIFRLKKYLVVELLVNKECPVGAVYCMGTHLEAYTVFLDLLSVVRAL